tara:strand:- start:136 stop:531 length:396 start_codon:yes stop_codon:yes gene_type:complete
MSTSNEVTKKNKKNTISLKVAKKWAKRWRKTESSYKNYQDCRAFNIPKADLVNVLKEDVASIRAYIGVAEFICPDTDEELYQEKLMIVGVDKDGKDMISSKDGVTLDEGSKEIYDFTRPCPDFCDLDSPLN